MSLAGVRQGQGFNIQPHPATGHLGRVDITEASFIYNAKLLHRASMNVCNCEAGEKKQRKGKNNPL